MFVCGPTVQGYLHVGHARTYTFYDVVARYLSHMGFEVNFLMNITDIDDKITQVAKEEGVDAMRLAEKYTKAFLEDTDSLKIYTVTKYEGSLTTCRRPCTKSPPSYGTETCMWSTEPSTSTRRPSQISGSSRT